MVAKNKAPAKKKVVVKRKVVVKKKAATKKKAVRRQRDEYGLTPQQRRFVDEYLIDLNATQAAIRAEYAVKGADVTGSKLLVNPKVAKAVADAKAKRAEEVGVDAKYVLLRHVAIDQMDVSDIMNDDGTLKPLSKWPKVWRTSLTGMEISEIMAGGDPIGMLRKIKWMDKTQNLKALGSHVDVQAYKDRLELSGTEEFEKLIEKRMRAIESAC